MNNSTSPKVLRSRDSLSHHLITVCVGNRSFIVHVLGTGKVNSHLAEKFHVLFPHSYVRRFVKQSRVFTFDVSLIAEDTNGYQHVTMTMGTQVSTGANLDTRISYKQVGDGFQYDIDCVGRDGQTLGIFTFNNIDLSAYRSFSTTSFVDSDTFAAEVFFAIKRMEKDLADFGNDSCVASVECATVNVSEPVKITSDADIVDENYRTFVIGLGRIHPGEKEQIVVLLPETLLRRFSPLHHARVLAGYRNCNFNPVNGDLHSGWGNPVMCSSSYRSPAGITFKAPFKNRLSLPDVVVEFDVDIREYRVISFSTIKSPAEVSKVLQSDLADVVELLKQKPATEPVKVEININ